MFKAVITIRRDRQSDHQFTMTAASKDLLEEQLRYWSSAVLIQAGVQFDAISKLSTDGLVRVLYQYDIRVDLQREWS